MSGLSRRDFVTGATATGTALLASACGGGDSGGGGFLGGDDEIAGVAEGEGRVSVPGGEVYYRVTGGGPGAPLLVVHGGPGLSHDYLVTLEELGRDRPVIFYDQLDCGQSARTGDPGNWRVARFVSEIAEIRRALGLTKFHILGHSWGGALAVEYAALGGNSVLSCVLASPLISTDRWVEDNRRWRRLLPDDVQATLDRHERDGTVRSEEYLSLWGETDFVPTGTLRKYDGTESLARIRSPILFTCGEFDEAPPITMYRYAKLVDHAEIRVFKDASHTAHLEQTAAYNQAVSVFLSGIG
jgi:proline iminopeptidase